MPNPGVRSEAVGLLDPVKADTSVREALQILATGDQNEWFYPQPVAALLSEHAEP